MTAPAKFNDSLMVFLEKSLAYIKKCLLYLINSILILKRSIKSFNMKTITIVICLIVLGVILYPSIRYEKATVGRYDIMYDRFEDAVYIKNALRPDAEWRETGFKNMKQAKYRLEQRQREEAAEAAQEELQQKQEELQQKLDEIQQQQEDMKEQQESERMERELDPYYKRY